MFSKGVAISITTIWVITILAYIFLKGTSGVDILAGLLSVSGVETIVVSGYFTKAYGENKAKINLQPPAIDEVVDDINAEG